MTIDMHSHLRPVALAEALRGRTKPPLIETNADGIEVIKSPRGETPVEGAFDDVGERLRDMDKYGISTAVLSLFGAFQWIERAPIDEAKPLVQLYNDCIAEVCDAHPGRFAAYASLPLADMGEAVAEFRRALDLPGTVGAVVPGNAFLTYQDAQGYAPLLEVANERKAVLFVHWNPRPEDAWPRVKPGTDNFLARLGTLDMQASLSANMVTLCMTDFLDAYPDARFHIHNLGGNIPFEIERMDHRNYLDTPAEPLPSSRLAKPGVFVDCNSFGARAIEAGVAVYGANKIMFGTDGTGFGCDWTLRALDEARINDNEREAILHGTASHLLAHLVPLAEHRQAAE